MRCELPEFDAPESARWAALLPAWLISISVHLLLAVVGVLLVRSQQVNSTKTDEIRPGQIVLVRRDANRVAYFTDEDTAVAHQVLRPIGGEIASAGPQATPTAAVAVADPPPSIPGLALPQLAGNVPVGRGPVLAPQLGQPRFGVRLPRNPADDAAILAADALIPREEIPTGPTAQLSLFGSAQAEGRSFVFVIDRSHSMGSDGLGAIGAAAQELAAHIDQLSSEQTFQVVAYNEATTFFTGRELIAATPENKRRLIRFVADLAAFGQTEHSRGLLAALRLKPEVIFLLTDGGEPLLDPLQLRTIRDAAASRTSIHCLHFGRGPAGEGSGVLNRVAAENRGSYLYIDMNSR